MILDYIDNLSLSEEEVKAQDYVCQTLARLAEGLFWINETVSKIENEIRTEAIKDDVRVSLAGELLDGKSLGLVSNAFQWYASSICNYAQLVGWLAYGDPQQAKSYLQKVLPNLSNYRNKVAAHFARADPRKKDNEASRTASVITNIVYAAGHLHAGALSLIKVGDQDLGESNIKSWSVIKVHQELVKRFWLNGKPHLHGAIMIPRGSKLRCKISIGSPL